MHLRGADYAQVRSNFRWDVPQTFNIGEAVCGRHARSMPDAPALIIEEADGSVRVWSFGELDTAACRFANALAALGVSRGVVVAIHVPQCAESAISHIAVQKLGAIALPLFNLFGPDAVRYRLDDSGARVLITTPEGFERIHRDIADLAMLGQVICVGGGGGVAGGGGLAGAADFWSLAERGAASITPADTAADDPALLMYTSGTTGNPKGCLHAGRVLLGHLPGVMLPHDLFPRSGDRFWTPADWAWAGGLLDVLLPSLYFGVPVVAARRMKFDPEWAFAFMAKHAIRNVFMPPTALRLMRGVAQPRQRYNYRLRSIGSGGEKLGADMLAWGEETFGFTMSEFYGQTEVNLVVANCASLFPARAGSMGRAVPGHTVEIVDDAGNVLPPGQPGVVAVHRPDPVMFLEYWKKPEATAEKFRGDWCLLGDVAVKDEDGYFWFQGRDDDIISSAGYRIGPTEVEESLMQHPAVAMAGVIGSPDPIRGEVVSAFVVPKAGFAPSDALATEIQAFVRTRLAAHEYPRKVRFISEMPMTITGKVRRVDLRKLDREG